MFHQGCSSVFLLEVAGYICRLRPAPSAGCSEGSGKGGSGPGAAPGVTAGNSRTATAGTRDGTGGVREPLNHKLAGGAVDSGAVGGTGTLSPQRACGG